MSRSTARFSGERGMATVTGLVLLFAFTAGAVIWLARDVDRAVSNRTAAQSIAFQAARSGAQQVGVAALRSDGSVVIDANRAHSAAVAAATQLFTSYGVTGTVVRVSVVGRDVVEVEVRVDDPAGAVTGVAAVRSEAG